MTPRGNSGQGGLERNEGFTLIELLVVILIIGLLAAIAIPVFLHQREKAYNSAMKSDIHTLAEFEESYLIDRNNYGSFAELTGAGYDVRTSRNVTVSVTVDAGLGYCLKATHPGSTATWYYDPRAGGLQQAGASGCPVTTGGVDGGSVTG